MSELDVDPELFYDLSGQYSKASRSASDALSAMDGELRSAEKMAGDDDYGLSWGRGYFVCGIEAAVTAGRATEVLAQMAALIRQTGINHDQSESAEDYNNGMLPPSDPGSKTFICRPLKSPAGGSRAKPAAWDLVMAPTKWINGDAELMARVATSWLTAASVYSTLDTDLRAKMKNLNGSKTDELPDLEQAHSSVLDGIETLSDGMRSISGAVDGYSHTLKDVQEYAEAQLTLLGIVLGLDALGTLISGGALFWPAQKLAEKEINLVRSRIDLALTTLLAPAEQAATGVFNTASNTVRFVMTSKFKPVLEKQLKNPPAPTRAEVARRNKLEGAKGEARAGIDPLKKKEAILVDGRKRFPDDIDDRQQRLTEVKNVQRQALTEQLKDDLTYCQRKGYEFVLITDNNTVLSTELQDLVNQGKIKHVRMDLAS